MRVPSLGVAPTLPLFTCVLRAQSTNASLTAQRPANTELFKQWIEQWKPSAYRMEAVVELFGQAPGPVEPKAVSAKVRARTTPSWLGVGLIQFKSIRESKN